MMRNISPEESAELARRYGLPEKLVTIRTWLTARSLQMFWRMFTVCGMLTCFMR